MRQSWAAVNPSGLKSRAIKRQRSQAVDDLFEIDGGPDHHVSESHELEQKELLVRGGTAKVREPIGEARAKLAGVRADQGSDVLV